MAQHVSSLDCWQGDLLAMILPPLLERGIGVELEQIAVTGLTFRYAGRTVRIAIEEVDPVPSDSWPTFDQRPRLAVARRSGPIPSEDVDRMLAAMGKGFCAPEDVVDPDD